MQNTIKYDIGIIGGGPGGYTAALEAAVNGLQVVLFESDELGGTCLNRGCIPTKYLAHIANIRKEAYESGDGGLSFTDCVVDYKKIQEKKLEIIASLKENLRNSLIKAGVTLVKGKAELMDVGHIACDGKDYLTEYVIIATGATAKERYAKGFLTSDEVLELEELPASIKIVGGGIIAVEFAQIFSSLGVDVKMQIRAERILRKWNREAAQSIVAILKNAGVKIETKCSPEVMQEADAQVCISATGMKPILDGLNLELLQVGECGGIVVNEYGQTATQRIYAVGDVTESSTWLAHHAMEEGRRVVAHILGRKIPAHAAVVSCIYTNPEIANVGYTEEEAASKNIPYVSVKVPLYSNAMNMIYGGKRGYIRLIADREKRTLIGAQLMYERASDIVSELALCINAGVDITRCAQSVRPHPTFAEGLSDAFCELVEKLK